MSDYKAHYPLLEALLAQLGLKLKGRYKIADAAEIFGQSRHTIQDWIQTGKLTARDMGHYRFLSEDFEDFLRKSMITGPRRHREQDLETVEGLRRKKAV
jgi:excisionase family DNA binding protein